MKKFTVVQVCFIALSAVINIIGGNLALVIAASDLSGQYRDISGIGAAWPSWRSSCRGGQRCDFWHHDRYLFALFYSGADSDRSGCWNSFSDNVVKKMEYFSWGILCVNCGNNYQCVHHSVCVWRSDIFRLPSILVTLFRQTRIEYEFSSAFVVQIVTDYADRLISIAIVVAVLAVLSNSMKQQIREGKTNGQV